MKRHIKSAKAINDLYASAYQAGIENVANILNKQFGLHLSYRDDFEKIDQIAQLLGLRFDENGEII